MADIKIHREHGLGMPKARKLAFQWAEQVEQDYAMDCTYEEGAARDVVSFTRLGVNGTLVVTKAQFTLEASLGFFVAAYKEKIEAEIVKKLDVLLAQKSPSRKRS